MLVAVVWLSAYLPETEDKNEAMKLLMKE